MQVEEIHKLAELLKLVGLHSWELELHHHVEDISSCAATLVLEHEPS